MPKLSRSHDEVDAIEPASERSSRSLAIAAGLVAATWTLAQVYVGITGFRDALVQRPLHVSLATALAFLMTAQRQRGGRVREAIAIALAVASMIPGVYLLLNEDRIVLRFSTLDPVFATDVVMGAAMIVLVVEAGRRLLGNGLTILAVAFIAYAFLGPRLPGRLGHAGTDLATFVDVQFLSQAGLYGIPTGVSVEVVFYFILFAAFLNISGGGRLFIDLTLRLTGRRTGGPAKSAVLASGAMGSISGSATANVVSTGVFTIPLMKRSGLPARVAGGTEAAASTGGQLVPPIMGAGAFVMAELTGIPYLTIAGAAIIPAVLYYFGLLVVVDLEARRTGSRGMRAEDLPSLGRDVLKRLHLLVPIGVLVYLLVGGASLTRSAMLSLASGILVSYVSRATWITPRRLLDGLVQGGRAAVAVAIPCAIAGIVVGIVIETGVGLVMSSLIANVAQFTPILALVAVTVCAIVLGMGMPTTSAYILGAVLLVPAVQALGVTTLSAHMFVYYFSILSMVTPPIALAAYAAAGIADSKLNETGYTAFRYSLVGFLVPFGFVFNEAYFGLAFASGVEVAIVVATGLLGVAALGVATTGYLMRRLGIVQRLVITAGSCLLIWPSIRLGLIGLAVLVACLAVTFLPTFRSRSKQESSEESSSEATT